MATIILPQATQEAADYMSNVKLQAGTYGLSGVWQALVEREERRNAATVAPQRKVG